MCPKVRDGWCHFVSPYSPAGRGLPGKELHAGQISHQGNDKEVFTLHALGDIPLKRISQLFGKSDSWARVTYYRAKAMITAKLEEGEK